MHSFAAVTWSAFRAGSCAFVSWRTSQHARSGRVACAWFGSAVAAQAFAAQWAAALGRSVVVRRVALGAPVRPSWVVSVPVASWPGAQHGQVLVVGGGGMRGVAAALLALGFQPAKAA